MTLERAYVNGRLAAFGCYKLGWPSATDPTVAGSGVLQAKSVSPTLPQTAQANMTPPTTPQSLTQIFDAHEQGETRAEPHRKLSADLCTTCRKAKHYGSCDHPRPIPTKSADFNAGMLGSDPTQGDNPSTSPHYHSAVSSISSLGRSSDGRPADEQAASGFADIFRHQGIRDSADQPGRMYGGLNKVADEAARERARRHEILFRMYGVKLSDFFTNMPGAATHSMHEQRGTPINPYEERLTVKSPPLGWGDEGPQRIERAFDQIDCAADSTGIEDASKGQPSGGPAVLG
jgi:hypothetical protein